MNEGKAFLRKQMMARLRQMAVADREAASRRIAEQVLLLPVYRKAKTIMAFLSMPTEPDTREIIADAVHEGKTVLLPRCLQAPEMEALPWRGEESLRPGPFGILEPVPLTDQANTPVPEPELILVPCVAATRKGWRLGHGGGYYDWFLRNRYADTVCLCFAAQIVESLPADANDVMIDRVIWA